MALSPVEGRFEILRFAASQQVVTGRSSAWIERTVRDREVASSNLVAPIFAPRQKSEQESTALLRSTHDFLLSSLTHPSGCAARKRERAVAFDFQKLIVYQKAVDFADVICDHTQQFERGYGFLADQLNRSALSNNVAEGNGRFTKADRRHFFGIARGSDQECVPMLELARRRRLVTDADHASLTSRLEEIARMLAGLINGLENRDV
jgi:four helix bundle protein